MGWQHNPFLKSREATHALRSTSVRRPNGVALIAAVSWVGAALYLVATTASVLDSNLTLAFLLFTLAVAALAMGVGLWRLWPWARRSAAVLCWAGLLVGSTLFAWALLQEMRGVTVDPAFSVEMFLGVLWNGLWAVYLRQPSVRAAFHN